MNASSFFSPFQHPKSRQPRKLASIPALAAVFALLTGFSVAASAAAGESQPETWRIAVPADAGPFSTTTEGEARGFDVDLLTASARIAAHPVIFVPSDSTDNALASLAAGEVDAVAGVAFEQAGSLPDSAKLSGNYRTERLIGYVENDALFRDADDLPHASIAAPANSAAQRYAQIRGWNLVETDSWRDAFRAVSTGKADATLCDPAIANQQLLDGKFENLRALPGVVHESGVALALAPSAAGLADGVESAKRTGHATWLANRWGITESREAPKVWTIAGIDYRALAYGGLVLLAAILVLTRRTGPRRRPNPGGVTTTPVIGDQ